MKKHLLLWFNGIGVAYEAANLAAQKGATILELFPFSSKGHLFLQTEADFDHEKFKSQLSSQPEHFEAFQNLSEKVLHAYLSLTNPPLAEDLIISESSYLGETFKVANLADKMGLTILDLRFLRDTTGHSFVQLTGSAQLCKDFLLQLPPHKVKTHHIASPSEGLRDFFPKPI